MESIAVTKPNMAVLGDRTAVTPFGLLACAFAEEILARSSGEEALRPYVPLDLLQEEAAEGVPASVEKIIQLNVTLNLDLLRQEKTITERQKATERILERVLRIQTQERERQSAEKRAALPKDGPTEPSVLRQEQHFHTINQLNQNYQLTVNRWQAGPSDRLRPAPGQTPARIQPGEGTVRFSQQLQSWREEGRPAPKTPNGEEEAGRAAQAAAVPSPKQDEAGRPRQQQPISAAAGAADGRQSGTELSRRFVSPETLTHREEETADGRSPEELRAMETRAAEQAARRLQQELTSLTEEVRRSAAAEPQARPHPAEDSHNTESKLMEAPAEPGPRRTGTQRDSDRDDKDREDGRQSHPAAAQTDRRGAEPSAERTVPSPQREPLTSVRPIQTTAERLTEPARETAAEMQTVRDIRTGGEISPALAPDQPGASAEHPLAGMAAYPPQELTDRAEAPAEPEKGQSVPASARERAKEERKPAAPDASSETKESRESGRRAEPRPAAGSIERATSGMGNAEKSAEKETPEAPAAERMEVSRQREPLTVARAIRTTAEPLAEPAQETAAGMQTVRDIRTGGEITPALAPEQPEVSAEHPLAGMTAYPPQELADRVEAPAEPESVPHPVQRKTAEAEKGQSTPASVQTERRGTEPAQTAPSQTGPVQSRAEKEPHESRREAEPRPMAEPIERATPETAGTAAPGTAGAAKPAEIETAQAPATEQTRQRESLTSVRPIRTTADLLTEPAQEMAAGMQTVRDIRTGGEISPTLTPEQPGEAAHPLAGMTAYPPQELTDLVEAPAEPESVPHPVQRKTAEAEKGQSTPVSVQAERRGAEPAQTALPQTGPVQSRAEKEPHESRREAEPRPMAEPIERATPDTAGTAAPGTASAAKPAEIETAQAPAAEQTRQRESLTSARPIQTTADLLTEPEQGTAAGMQTVRDIRTGGEISPTLTPEQPGEAAHPLAGMTAYPPQELADRIEAPAEPESVSRPIQRNPAEQGRGTEPARTASARQSPVQTRTREETGEERASVAPSVPSETKKPYESRRVAESRPTAKPIEADTARAEKFRAAASAETGTENPAKADAARPGKSGVSDTPSAEQAELSRQRESLTSARSIQTTADLLTEPTQGTAAGMQTVRDIRTGGEISPALTPEQPGEAAHPLAGMTAYPPQELADRVEAPAEPESLTRPAQRRAAERDSGQAAPETVSTERREAEPSREVNFRQTPARQSPVRSRAEEEPAEERKAAAPSASPEAKKPYESSRGPESRPTARTIESSAVSTAGRDAAETIPDDRADPSRRRESLTSARPIRTAADLLAEPAQGTVGMQTVRDIRTGGELSPALAPDQPGVSAEHPLAGMTAYPPQELVDRADAPAEPEGSRPAGVRTGRPEPRTRQGAPESRQNREPATAAQQRSGTAEAPLQAKQAEPSARQRAERPTAQGTDAKPAVTPTAHPGRNPAQGMLTSAPWQRVGAAAAGLPTVQAGRPPMGILHRPAPNRPGQPGETSLYARPGMAGAGEPLLFREEPGAEGGQTAGSAVSRPGGPNGQSIGTVRPAAFSEGTAPADRPAQSAESPVTGTIRPGQTMTITDPASPMTALSPAFSGGENRPGEAGSPSAPLYGSLPGGVQMEYRTAPDGEELTASAGSIPVRQGSSPDRPGPQSGTRQTGTVPTAPVLSGPELAYAVQSGQTLPIGGTITGSLMGRRSAARFPAGAQGAETAVSRPAHPAEGPAPVELAFPAPPEPPADRQEQARPGRNQSPVPPGMDSDYVRSLPDWAQRFLQQSPGQPGLSAPSMTGTQPMAGARPMQTSAEMLAAAFPQPGEEQVSWTAPGYRPTERLSFREKGDEAQGEKRTEEVRISDAEIRRMSDQVYRMIEDRIRWEKRRLGL